MSAPRHLWSGDWEQDSAAHAEALARRNAERRDEPEPEEEPRVARPAVSSVPAEPGATFGDQLARLAVALGRVLLAILRAIGLVVVALAGALRSLLRAAWRAVARSDRRRLRLVALAALLIAVIAVAAVAVFGSGGSGPSSANASPAAVASIERWLGVQLTEVPSRGVVFETIDPGGVAARFGFEPGDTVAQIDNHAINNLGDAVNAFSGVQPGNQIAITVNRGSSVYSASFPMPSRPPGGP
jgi:membrane-associated protease RseP (regulator of RpoE activity)